jgi:hypothetical protein
MGYVVYVLQPSGATGFGQEFSALHVNEWGKIVADEIIDGTQEFLAAHDFVDPKRVGCIGASFGGFMTQLIVCRGIQGIGLQYATCNRGACHVKGYTIAVEVLGCGAKLDPHVTKDKPFWVKLFQDLTAAVDASGGCIFGTFGMDGSDYAAMLSALTGVTYTTDEYIKAGERIIDLQEKLLHAQQELEFMATHDSLSGLQNRYSILEALRRELSRARRDGREVGIILVDIDHFKKVNDTFGHTEGDQVLCKISSLLKSSVRKKDTVARYGGEEFILILPEPAWKSLL